MRNQFKALAMINSFWVLKKITYDDKNSTILSLKFQFRFLKVVFTQLKLGESIKLRSKGKISLYINFGSSLKSFKNRLKLTPVILQQKSVFVVLYLCSALNRLIVNN